MKQAKTQPLNAAYHQLSLFLNEVLASLHTNECGHNAKTKWQKAGIALSVYERHIAKEEAVLFGVLHEYEPCVGAILLNDYRIITKHIALVRKVITAHKIYDQNNHCLLTLFREFVSLCLAQMKEHQSIINPVLWRYYSNEELAQLASAFTIKKLAPAYRKKAIA